MLKYRIIDLNTYPHRAHLEYFMGHNSPAAGISTNVDVTRLVQFCKEEKCSFNLDDAIYCGCTSWSGGWTADGKVF